MIQLTDCTKVRLATDTPIKEFDCGDSDLNEFLSVDAKHYLSNLLAVTYLYEYQGNLVVFFSVSNDTISFKEKSLSSAEWRRLRKTYPHRKRLSKLPAAKIGRLGVDKKFKGNHIGTQLLDYIKILFIDNNKTGCRYLTVDAYNRPEVIGFYKKNGFLPLTVLDEDKDTRLMYFDLKQLQLSAAI